MLDTADSRVIGFEGRSFIAAGLLLFYSTVCSGFPAAVSLVSLARGPIPSPGAKSSGVKKQLL
jgi:hypothetical protein